MATAVLQYYTCIFLKHVYVVILTHRYQAWYRFILFYHYIHTSTSASYMYMYIYFDFYNIQYLFEESVQYRVLHIIVTRTSYFCRFLRSCHILLLMDDKFTFKFDASSIDCCTACFNLLQYGQPFECDKRSTFLSIDDILLYTTRIISKK